MKEREEEERITEEGYYFCLPIVRQKEEGGKRSLVRIEKWRVGIRTENWCLHQSAWSIIGEKKNNTYNAQHKNKVIEKSMVKLLSSSMSQN